jgi:hypothetical protein
MNKSIYFLLVLLAVISCRTETELKKTVFIEDKDNPGLPVYSEWGYNTFGAYYDRAPFISKQFIPSKVIMSDDTTRFQLIGSREGGTYTFNENTIISFALPDIKPAAYQDLVALDKKRIDLKATKVSVLLDYDNYPLEVIEGFLEFSRAQTLVVDKKYYEVILSGYFEIKAIIHGQPVTISNGRFDVGVGDDNFFIYD